jgi:hypothetical protein
MPLFAGDEAIIPRKLPVHLKARGTRRTQIVKVSTPRPPQPPTHCVTPMQSGRRWKRVLRLARLGASGTQTRVHATAVAWDKPSCGLGTRCGSLSRAVRQSKGKTELRLGHGWDLDMPQLLGRTQAP